MDKLLSQSQEKELFILNSLVFNEMNSKAAETKKRQIDTLIAEREMATFHFKNNICISAVPTKYQEIGRCLCIYLEDADCIQSGYCALDSITSICN